MSEELYPWRNEKVEGDKYVWFNALLFWAAVFFAIHAAYGQAVDWGLIPDIGKLIAGGSGLQATKTISQEEAALATGTELAKILPPTSTPPFLITQEIIHVQSSTSEPTSTIRPPDGSGGSGRISVSFLFVPFLRASDAEGNKIAYLPDPDWSGTVRVSYYLPWLGGTNCADFVDGYCNSATASGIPWEVALGWSAACPPDWPLYSAVYLWEIQKVFVCLDRGGSIICNGEYCWLDMLGEDRYIGFHQAQVYFRKA
jgi:hypothetical protein